MENSNNNQGSYPDNEELKPLTETVTKIGEAVLETTAELIANTAATASLVGDLASNTTSEMQKLVELAADRTGQTLEAIADNSLLRFLTNILGADWLLAMLGEVEVDRLQATVAELKQKYPQEDSTQIARRIIANTAWEAGKVGLLTNIIPPVAALLLGVELAATTKLQAEMIFQIAAAYDLDLNEPARRGEVLAIFGLSLGGGLVKSGLNFVEIVPGIGAVVGASTNAIIIAALGYTACYFYEDKFQSRTVNLEPDLEAESYWQTALDQAAIIDRLLICMALVSYPDCQSERVISAWKQVSPTFARRISFYLENPQSLDTLLDQLNPDLALLVLAKCYQIAQLDGTITPEERVILEKIAQKFQLDLTLKPLN